MLPLLRRLRQASLGPLSRLFGHCPALTLNLVGFGVVLVIGWLDYVTGPELILTVFYFIPVAISAWYAGTSSGVLLSCLSVATMFMVDVLARRYQVSMVPGLNAVIRLGFFLFVVYILRRRRIAEDRIRELMRLKNEFTAMVSHELRTPLSAIKEGLAMVLDQVAGPLSEKQRQYLEIVGRSVERLDRLVTGVLDFQKLDAGRMEFAFEACDVNTLVTSVVNAFAPVAAKRGLELRIDLAAGLPEVMCDRDKITQVVSNLLDNALKFTKQGCIRVATDQENDAVRVAVQDPGIGIPKEELPRLFQRFTQIRSGDNKSDGVGLGLAISRQIIEHHQGRLGVESAPGRGSTFRFTLPLTQTSEFISIGGDE